MPKSNKLTETDLEKALSRSPRKEMRLTFCQKASCINNYANEFSGKSSGSM